MSFGAENVAAAAFSSSLASVKREAVRVVFLILLKFFLKFRKILLFFEYLQFIRRFFQKFPNPQHFISPGFRLFFSPLQFSV